MCGGTRNVDWPGGPLILGNLPALALLFIPRYHLNVCKVHCFQDVRSHKDHFQHQLFRYICDSRACWVNFIATSASLYSHNALYNLVGLCVNILNLNATDTPGTFGEMSPREPEAAKSLSTDELGTL